MSYLYFLRLILFILKNQKTVLPNMNILRIKLYVQKALSSDPRGYYMLYNYSSIFSADVELMFQSPYIPIGLGYLTKVELCNCFESLTHRKKC